MAEEPVWPPAKGSLTDAWTCGPGGVPILMYDGKIEITYESGYENVDNDTFWPAYVREHGGHVEQVLGRTAYVHSADDTPPTRELRPGEYRHPDPRRLNAVEVIVDATMILLLSKTDVSTDQLVDLAESIQLPPDLASSTK